MRPRLGTALVALLLAGFASGAQAGELALTINDGRVTLRAGDVTVAQILAEWARVGNTRILNLDRVPADLVTLELTNVPEAEALDIVLRSASGYVAAPRAVAVTSASLFDRILVMPPSVAPPAAAGPRFTPPPAAQGQTGFRPIFPRPGAPEAAVDPDDEEPEAEPPAMSPPGAFGQPGFAPVQPQPAPQAFPGGVELQRIQPAVESPDSDGVPPSGANPWGVPPGTSAKPGTVIQPPPGVRPQPNPPR